MNKHIRRVAIAVGVLMVALFLNLNFVQVVKGDDYRNNSANRRVILTEYASPRGQIVFMISSSWAVRVSDLGRIGSSRCVTNYLVLIRW